ncbi:MAG TPA: carbon starvation protein A [Planctomycetes bacterium]|nr:carbon starvation protein A [Planctomycetota bacterium]
MPAAFAAGGAFLVYFLGYRFYSGWLARRIFRLSQSAVTPAYALRDGVDFLPTRPQVLFGHHYASIAGLAPMLGPAVAVFWGWLPALLWVVFGAIFIGCVHDFAALVLSIRHRGESIGSLCESILGARAKALFLGLIFFGISLAMGVFVFVISKLFTWGDDFDPSRLDLATTSFPESVLPSAGLMVVAMIAGWLLHRKRFRLFPVAVVSYLALLLLVGAGYYFPVLGVSGPESWPATQTWVWILLGYAWLASVLPVWFLLQARDFLNALLLGTGLLLMYSGFFLSNPTFDAPAFNPNPVGAPPLLPFVFITVACGAVSGFHALVSSGTTARQLAKETHARPVGYGGMLAESLLALLAVLACTCTLGGKEAWAKVYLNWASVQGLDQKLGVFIRGSASFVQELGIPGELAVTLVAMVVVSFALTTLDSATRLLRFNLEEIGRACANFPCGRIFRVVLANRFLAAAVACSAIAFFAFYEVDGRPAGLALWQLFGGTNQLIAGLTLLTAAVWLKQSGRPSWPLFLPGCGILVLTLVALGWKMRAFWEQSEVLLLVLAGALVFIGLGVGGAGLSAFFGRYDKSRFPAG